MLPMKFTRSGDVIDRETGQVIGSVTRYHDGWYAHGNPGRLLWLGPHRTRIAAGAVLFRRHRERHADLVMGA